MTTTTTETMNESTPLMSGSGTGGLFIADPQTGTVNNSYNVAEESEGQRKEQPTKFAGDGLCCCCNGCCGNNCCQWYGYCTKKVCCFFSPRAKSIVGIAVVGLAAVLLLVARAAFLYPTTVLSNLQLSWILFVSACLSLLGFCFASCGLLKRIDDCEAKLDNIQATLGDNESTLDKHEAKLDNIGVKLDNFGAKLDNLDAKFSKFFGIEEGTDESGGQPVTLVSTLEKMAAEFATAYGLGNPKRQDDAGKYAKAPSQEYGLAASHDDPGLSFSNHAYVNTHQDPLQVAGPGSNEQDVPQQQVVSGVSQEENAKKAPDDSSSKTTKAQEPAGKRRSKSLP